MAPYWSNNIATLYRADARCIPLEDKSVHMVVTSPPYWGLRDYGLGQWEGGDGECDHAKPPAVLHMGSNGKLGTNMTNWDGAHKSWPNGICGKCGARQQVVGIGLEPTLAEWVENIVAVMREVRRVLRDDGTVWLNLGDAYAGSGKGRNANGYHSQTGVAYPAMESLPPQHWNHRGVFLESKQLMGQPWRVAFALQDDGWYLRKDIIWHKPNPMPESVTDRPTTSHECIFLLSKQPRYYYDAEAVKQPAEYGYRNHSAEWRSGQQNGDGHRSGGGSVTGGDPSTGANLRDVWTIPTQGLSGAVINGKKIDHYAAFPEELPRRCILAGTSEHGVCGECGSPWVREVEHIANGNNRKASHVPNGRTKTSSTGWEPQTKAGAWQPTCECNADRIPATVLDPFAGSGTTLAVAQALGRKAVGLDLNPEYLALAVKRITNIPLPMQI